MRTGPTFRRVLLCLLSLPLLASGQTSSISTEQYLRQLQDLNAKIAEVREHPEQAKAVEDSVPDRISINCKSGECSLSYEWLKKDLKQFQKADPQKRSAFLDHIQQKLNLFEEQARAYEQESVDSTSEHAKLGEILSRREFNRVHGPNRFDIWWEKVVRWLNKFFGSHPITGNSGLDLWHILVYSAVVVAFVLFAVWLKKRFDFARADDHPRDIMPFAPSARSWRSWLAEARALAQKEDWRNGIHLAYWAGISFLEEHGAWRPDRARTPREYLRLLNARNTQYPVLTALTRKFEITWYGQRSANATDFQETLGQLERLGCK